MSLSWGPALDAELAYRREQVSVPSGGPRGWPRARRAGRRTRPARPLRGLRLAPEPGQLPEVRDGERARAA